MTNGNSERKELTPEEQAKKFDDHKAALMRLPVVTEMAKTSGFADDVLQFESTLIKTVFPARKPGEAQITIGQVLMFLNVAREYKLNPFIREIYAFPKDGGVVPIVPIDGWISLVQRQKNYDGHWFEYEWQDGKPGGAMLSAKCIIKRKDTSHATEHTEYMVECVKDTGVWKKWPRRMLTHKAFIQCARYAFGLSGIYDEDEGERIMQGDGSEVIPPKEAVPLPQAKKAPMLEGQKPAQAAPQKQREAPAPVKAQQRQDEPPQPQGANVYDDIPDDEEPDARVAEGGEGYIDFLAEALGEPKREKPEPEPPANPVVTDVVKTLFDRGEVQKASTLPAGDRKEGTIGVGQAKFLHMRLGKQKKRTPEELEELLKSIPPPIGPLEHLRDLPIHMAKGVERWIDGRELEFKDGD
jgi:phage recombination protein Bet